MGKIDSSCLRSSLGYIEYKSSKSVQEIVPIAQKKTKLDGKNYRERLLTAIAANGLSKKNKNL